MKKFFALSLSLVFMLGVLFPVRSTGEGKSPFVEEIKKLFHFSSGSVSAPKKQSGPVVKGEKGTKFFQAVKDVFHYESSGPRRKAKRYPQKFDKAVKKQLRYPRTK